MVEPGNYYADLAQRFIGFEYPDVFVRHLAALPQYPVPRGELLNILAEQDKYSARCFYLPLNLHIYGAG